MTPLLWICSLHAKSSLILAFLPYPRLWFFKKKLKKDHKKYWEYRMALPGGDTIGFFPYTVVPEGIDIKIQRRKLGGYVALRKRTLMDPINIIAYGTTPQDFITLLHNADARWEALIGSVHFLHTPFGWKPSIAAKIDLNKNMGERYHIRLYMGESTQVIPVTFVAAHHDPPRDKRGRHPTTHSWNKVRELIGQGLQEYQQYLTDRATMQNFRGAEGDGKIRIIIMEQ